MEDKIDKLETVVADLNAIIKNKDMDLEDCQKTIDELTALIESLKDEKKALAIKAAKDHTNSSKPSSSDGYHAKITNSREKTDRKPGGQPGHEGQRRPDLAADETVDLGDPEAVVNNPDRYRLTDIVKKRKTVGIIVRPYVTEYIAAVYEDIETGEKIYVPFPDGVVNEINYDQSIAAFACLLNVWGNVSLQKTADIISQLSRGTLTLSKGYVGRLNERLSKATEEERTRMIEELVSSPYLHIDNTTVRVNGSLRHVFSTSNGDRVLYQYTGSKGRSAVEETPVNGYNGIIIHDHDITFYNFGSGHQECLSHIIRYLKASIEFEDHLTWNVKMKDLIQKMIHEVKSGDLSDEKISEFTAEYDRILELAEEEYERYKPTSAYRDGFNLAARMRKFKDAHLLFLHSSNIPYTNNEAERNLRKIKGKQKQAGTWRKEEGITHYCDVMSILTSAHISNANMYEALCERF